MSSTNKALPECDCLNFCGDDPAVCKGKATACERLKQRREQDLQQALKTYRVNTLVQQYGVATIYDLVEHLHTKVEQLPTNIDPRWADIDFDKVNAELRDMRDQIGRLQDFINRFQPVQAGTDGYVEAPTQAHGEVEYFGLEPWERDKLTSPTAGMNIAQRILHVGGRNNEAGYVEFGSIQAVEALVRQVLRDLPAQGGPNA